MVSVYVTVKSKKLNNDFCSCIDKSGFAKVNDTFSSLKDCKKQLAVKLPDVLLLGLDLTDGYWVDFCTEMRTAYPVLKIIAIVTYDEYCVFKNSLDNLTSGYISKDALPKVIFGAIREVMAGRQFHYDKIVSSTAIEESGPEKLLEDIRQTANQISQDATNQEIVENLTFLIDAAEQYRRLTIKALLNENKDTLDADCLDKYFKLLINNLFMKGYPNWEIADKLNIRIETVRFYRMELILSISGQNSLVLNVEQNKTIPLGRREQQILRLIAAGYSYKEIADKFLFVHIETVNTICDNLRRKFDAENSMTLVIKALRLGHIRLEDIDELIT